MISGQHVGCHREFFKNPNDDKVSSARFLQKKPILQESIKKKTLNPITRSIKNPPNSCWTSAVIAEIEYLMKESNEILFSQAIQCYCDGSTICSLGVSVCENEITWIPYVTFVQ